MNIISLLRTMLRVCVCLAPAVAGPAFANPEGEELYMEYCQSCHGADKSGVQNYTGDLADFSARLNGETEDMPDFTDFFEDDEIQALHEFVIGTD